MSALTIAGIEIHQDQDGRFSLNDFHRAAGGEKRHAPNEWLRNTQAQELVSELGKPG
ncbi:MAG: KilA-N domain-containing protein, partial [Pseudomonadota bacterium]